MRHFEGTCDVCHAPISTDWNDDGTSMVDYKVTDDGRMVTWIRHYGVAPEDANPDCAVYSSEVIETELIEPSEKKK